ncbi:MAG: serine/threonine protein kinase [Victivallaceae bacterium]|nr:serine/threonine protein kinase [Victivallaceae bacterium]
MSKVKFSCSACEAVLDAELNQVGSTLVCSACSASVKVPPYGVIPGMKIGDFVVERRLGIGGMGEVWLAEQSGMQRKVALKILAPELAANTAFVERFIHEAKLAGKLIHPNIVTAHHAGKDKNIQYLAIAYVDGIELDALLKSEEIINEFRALNIVRDIAQALKYAWDKFKIIHRDIKPSNIMLDKDNVAMLMDLGISKSLIEDISMTITGVMVGTPAYVSPEQAKAEIDIDFRADLYSLGVTLYRMLTGVLPFEAVTAMATVSKHLTDKLPDCRELNPKITVGCKQLIEKMMEKKKEDRYLSWSEFIDAIDKILSKNRTEIDFCCSKCTAALRVDAEFINSKVDCAVCGTELIVPAFGIVPGMEIGGCIIEKRLGAGGMGEVWLAEQSGMQRKVALKILSHELTDNLEFVKRFTQEARMAGKLIHPNIVTAYHAGEDKGIRYLVISYIDGVELSNLLKVENMMDEGKALQIVRDIAEALNYAWDKFNILHRDVKPGNIMIEQDSTAMLMDLGLSKIVSDDISLTVTGTAVGTPAYISPEQAKGEKDIDFRTDVYSLGATLFQMVTGELPFNARTGLEIASKHIIAPLPDCQKINPAITDSCKLLVEKMMEKDRESRCTSWLEIIDDIDKVLVGRKPLKNNIHNKILIFAAIGACSTIVILGAVVFGLVSKNRYGLAIDDVDAKQVVSEPAKNNDPNRVTTPILSDAEKKEIAERQKMSVAWSSAEKYLADNQNDFTANMVNFEKIKNLYPSTEYGKQAVDRIQQLKQAKNKSIAELIATLRGKATVEAERHNFDEAITFIRQYNGQWKLETVAAREKIVNTIKKQQKEYEAAVVKQQAETVAIVVPRKLELSPQQLLLNSVARLLLDGKVSEAEALYAESPARDKLPELSKIFAELENIPEIFKQQLRKEVGNEFALKNNGITSYHTLEKIKGRYLHLAIKNGSVTIVKKYPIKNISLEQKIYYLKKTKMASGALAVLLTTYYFKQENITKSLETAKQAGVLATAFKMHIMAELSTVSNEKAKNTLRNIMKRMGLKNSSFNQVKLIVELKTLKLATNKAQRLSQRLQEYKKNYSSADYDFVSQEFLSILENYLKAQSETEQQRFFNEIKSRLGTDDTTTRQLVPIVIKFKTDLQKNVAAGKAVHYLAPQMVPKIRPLLPPGKLPVFGMYVNELVKKYGYQLSPSPRR